MTPITKALQPPSLTDSLFSLRDEVFRTLNCVRIGEIQSFNPTKKTAEIQILTKRVLPSGNTASYPPLVDCPVFTLQGGGAAIQMPIQKGDQCIILFADRNIDAWFKNGSEAAPFDGRCHDLSDGLALVGLNSLTSALADYSDDELKIVYGGAKIALNNADLITIRNAAGSLLTVINGLIDVIKALTVTGAPIDPAGITALESYKTVIGGLLF